MHRMKPLIVDIHRNALDDGPGIRTTVFFKGCTLSCVWCQNPEAISSEPEVQRKKACCIGCGTCALECTAGATTWQQRDRFYDPARCELCGQCAEACPPGAIRIVGAHYPIDTLLDMLLVDEPFFRNSGGGITLSGGEPTLFVHYVAELARRLRERKVHVLLQTCGLYACDAVERELLPHLDMVFFDVKLADPGEHERYTGVDNVRIIDNLCRLAQLMPDRVLARVPLVPGITDSEANLRGVARIVLGAGLRSIAALPYNPLWIPKRADLGREPAYAHDRFMAPEHIRACKTVLEQAGLQVV